MSFTATVKIVATWTDTEGREFTSTSTIASVAKVREVPFNAIVDTYITIYDASQTTTSLGNSDAGDQPFGVLVRVTGNDAILEFTDDLGVITYETIPSGKGKFFPSDLMGSTTTARIEQIRIKAGSATALDGKAIFLID